MILIYLSSIWVVGIYIGSILKLPPLFCLFGIIPLVFLFLTRHRKVIILASLGIFLFFAAAVYSYGSLYTVDEGRIRYYNDLGTFQVNGVISRDPDVRDKSTRLTVATEEIYLDERWRDVEGTVLVIVPRYPEYAYGDFISIAGELQTPVELFGDIDGVLTGHAVGHQQDFIGIDLRFDLFEFRHHLIVDMQPTGGIEYDQINEVLLGIFDGLGTDLQWFPVFGGEVFDLNRVGQNLELFDSRGR